MIYDDILEAVGGTPLVRLNKLVPANSARVLVKFEGMNVGGSIKTRTALRMIREAEARGDLHERSIIVEPTSGNQGIGLALVAAVLGYRARIIMPDSVSIERRRLVSHYGALVLTVHDSGDIGACIQECIARAQRMAAEDENVYVPQQFENADNVAAHYEGTGAEILRDVDGPIDGFCSGIGTGGTITGVGETVKAWTNDVRIVAVEPYESQALSGGLTGPHGIPDIGFGLVPGNYNAYVVDNIAAVTTADAARAAQRVLRTDAIPASPSAGAALHAAAQLIANGTSRSALAVFSGRQSIL